MLRKNGQNLTEYALIIATVIMALVAMQAYVKRGFQGKHKDAVDGVILYLRNQTNQTGGGNIAFEYEPDYYLSSYGTHVNSTSRLIYDDLDETTVINAQTQRSGNMMILPVIPY
ncbi:MAG: hypothetical protein ABH954_04725 [Candidatus Omnitrophota bacterium]